MRKAHPQRRTRLLCTAAITLAATAMVAGATAAALSASAVNGAGRPKVSAQSASPVTSPWLATTSVPYVAVVGNHLVNAAGQTIRLLGIDRSGTEFECIQGDGIFDGPHSATSVKAMTRWGIDAVRLPLNEDCWLGINGVKPAYGGVAYKEAIAGYVKTLQSFGLVVILDLHWNAPDTTPATGQQQMADASHSPAFWASVATYFKNNHGVIFDLYNEPQGISWNCWLHGCKSSTGWQIAGMQSLVDAVRSTGATQPLMLGGIGWAGDLGGWLAHEPTDPLHQLVASFHNYNFGPCATAACWTSMVAPVAKVIPVVTGEMGENDCADGYIDSYMTWADANGISNLGWTWNSTSDGWTCTGGPSLIQSYSGTPTGFGVGLRDHLQALDAGVRGR